MLGREKTLSKSYPKVLLELEVESLEDLEDAQSALLPDSVPWARYVQMSWVTKGGRK